MTYILDPDCSFAGVPFVCRETGDLARAAFPSERRLAIRAVPWGNRTIIQDLGAQPTTLNLTLEVAKGTLPALQAKVGQVGTLALVGAAAQSGVLLQSLGDVTIDDTNNLAILQAQFLGGV